jgi:hypothetical protein
MTLVIVFHGSNRHAHFVHMVLCLEFDECWMREYWVEVVLNWVV